ERNRRQLVRARSRGGLPSIFLNISMFFDTYHGLTRLRHTLVYMTTADLLARADTALARTDWETAMRLFSEALADEESPEALEGVGTAAFFTSEGEAAIDARERAFARYREQGRPVDAARVAMALAWDFRIFRGERAVGDGWLARARRLLEASPTTT